MVAASQTGNYTVSACVCLDDALIPCSKHMSLLEDDALSVYWPLQIVVALLEPLQEGGALTVAASKALEELIIKGRSLLQAKLKGLPPLPQSVQVIPTLPRTGFRTQVSCRLSPSVRPSV